MATDGIAQRGLNKLELLTALAQRVEYDTGAVTKD